MAVRKENINSELVTEDVTEKFELPEVILSWITPPGLCPSHRHFSSVLEKKITRAKKLEITRVICDCLEGYLSIIFRSPLVKLALLITIHTYFDFISFRSVETSAHSVK